MPFYENVILGGGLVAGHAAQALVEGGLEPGHLAIISAESMLPYDRPPLSKAFLKGKATVEDLLINEPGFYRDNGIDTYLDDPVIQVDLANRQLYLSHGKKIEFYQLLIATGSRLRRFDLPGSNLFSIFYLRDFNDAGQIRRAAATAERAVVIGGSFIGMEVASVLRHYGLETTMIFPEDRVWKSFFTPPMSAFFQDYYRERGVNFLPEAEVKSFAGQNELQAVQIRQNNREHTLPADLVVAGIGVEPNVDLFSDSDLGTEDGILVDRYLETHIKGVFAAGDIAHYPDEIFNRFRRVEHWDNAVSQGQHAARVMLGNREPYRHVPYFFSDVFDLSYEFWGDAAQADVVVHRGDVSSGSFSVWWLADECLHAAFVMDRPEGERDLAPKWIDEQQPLSAESLADAARPVEDAALSPVPA